MNEVRVKSAKDGKLSLTMLPRDRPKLQKRGASRSVAGLREQLREGGHPLSEGSVEHREWACYVRRA